MTHTTVKKEKIGEDLIKFIAETIEGTAKNHLEAWKPRYAQYKKVGDVRFDLEVNHDDSLELEYAEQELKRELNQKEYDFFVDKFHRQVIKMCKPYINQF